MKVNEVIKWLCECSKDGPHNCKECPYNKDPYELGCGKLLSDAALLLSLAYQDAAQEIAPSEGRDC